jgi:hypothetical protein
MIFGCKKASLTEEINIKIIGEILNRVDHTKFLGIILDSACTWQPHIQYLTTKNCKVNRYSLSSKANTQQKP